MNAQSIAQPLKKLTALCFFMIVLILTSCQQDLGSANTVDKGQLKRYDRPSASILKGVELAAGQRLFISSGLVADAIDESLPPNAAGRYGDTYTQAISTLKKIEATLQEAGLQLSDVVKMTVYLAPAPNLPDGGIDFDAFFRAYGQFFNNEQNPTKVARTTLGVAALARPNLQIEIEVVAAYAVD